jgi:hypothetical protein
VVLGHDRQEAALGVGTTIWNHHWNEQDGDPRLLQRSPEARTEPCVAVAIQDLMPVQGPKGRVGAFPDNLEHERSIKIGRDACDGHRTGSRPTNGRDQSDRIRSEPNRLQSEFRT